MLYGKPIRYDEQEKAGLTPDFIQLASDALGNKAAYEGGKTVEEATIERVNGMKEEYGTGVSTLMTIYNATGSTLKLHELTSTSGKMFKYPADETIYNGQWSCFLHVKTSGSATGSAGSVSYWLEGGVSKKINQLIVTWDTPWSGTNTVSATFFDASYLIPGSNNYIPDIFVALGKMQSETPFGARASVSQTSSPMVQIVATRKTLL